MVLKRLVEIMTDDAEPPIASRVAFTSPLGEIERLIFAFMTVSGKINFFELS